MVVDLTSLFLPTISIFGLPITRNFDLYGKTNSFSESENAQLKGSNIGPDANHKLDRSGKANVETTNKRFNKIQGKPFLVSELVERFDVALK